MKKTIIYKGKKLTFSIKKDKDGWFAQCKEYSGIMTGGKSKSPSDKKIIENLLIATKTAFHTPIRRIENEVAREFGKEIGIIYDKVGCTFVCRLEKKIINFVLKYKK